VDIVLCSSLSTIHLFSPGLWPVITGAWPDEMVHLVLFDDMADPAGDTPKRKDQKGCAGGQTKDTTGCDQAKVQAWRFANLGIDRIARRAYNACRR
jgi:hypothetical protein